MNARTRPHASSRRRELVLLAVEEAVRRAVVREDVVLDAGLGQRPVERGVELGRDAASSPAWRARIGASIRSASWVGPGRPSRSPGLP